MSLFGISILGDAFTSLSAPVTTASAKVDQPTVEVSAPVEQPTVEESTPTFSYTPDAVVEPSAQKKDEFAKCLERFEATFASVASYVPWEKSWGSDVHGYESLRLAVNIKPRRQGIALAEHLEIGAMFKTIDPHGVKILVIGSRVGPVVVYEATDHPCCFRAVGERSLHLLKILSFECMHEEAELCRIIGRTEDPDMSFNIGEQLEWLYSRDIISAI